MGNGGKPCVEWTRGGSKKSCKGVLWDLAGSSFFRHYFIHVYFACLFVCPERDIHVTLMQQQQLTQSRWSTFSFTSNFSPHDWLQALLCVWMKYVILVNILSWLNGKGGGEACSFWRRCWTRSIRRVSQRAKIRHHVIDYGAFVIVNFPFQSAQVFKTTNHCSFFHFSFSSGYPPFHLPTNDPLSSHPNITTTKEDALPQQSYTPFSKKARPSNPNPLIQLYHNHVYRVHQLITTTRTRKWSLSHQLPWIPITQLNNTIRSIKIIPHHHHHLQSNRHTSHLLYSFPRNNKKVMHLDFLQSWLVMKTNVAINLPKWWNQHIDGSWKGKRSTLVPATYLVISKSCLMTRAISNGYDSQSGGIPNSTDFVGEYIILCCLVYCLCTTRLNLHPFPNM